MPAGLLVNFAAREYADIGEFGMVAIAGPIARRRDFDIASAVSCSLTVTFGAAV